MTYIQKGTSKHLTFSQRYGYEPLPQPMQLGELSRDLRIELWNSVREFLFSKVGLGGTSNYFCGNNRRFIERILGKIANKPEDEIPHRVTEVMDVFKEVFGDQNFNVVLDLIEILVNDADSTETFSAKIKNSFEQYAAPYWLDISKQPFQFFPQSSKEQGDAVRQAIKTLHENNMGGAVEHFRRAAKHMRSKDWGDSIVDSIHAVESVARIIDPKASKTLDPALNSLKKAGLLKHKALMSGLQKIYGYTNDEQGLRHALTDQNEPNVGLDEALFMFGACASFAAYLVNKERQMRAL